MTGPTAGHVRLTAGGNIGASQTWSHGFSVAAAGGGLDQSQVQGLLQAFATAYQTSVWGSGSTPLKTRNSSLVTLRSFRAYYYPFGGPPSVFTAAIDIAPIQGVGASDRHPPQVSLVASLLTGLPGRKYRGRTYMPTTALALGSDLQASQTDLDTLAAALKAVIDAVNTYTTTAGPGDVVIAGSAGNIPVTQVRIDSEPDIQRRRADKILAARTGIANIA